LPFAATDEIKLGYSTIAGSFTIKIDRCIFFGQNVFIEDKFNNVNLKNENFTLLLQLEF
jgi:hypothetical protein